MGRINLKGPPPCNMSSRVGTQSPYTLGTERHYATSLVFFSWALSQQCKKVSTHRIPLVMTRKKSPAEVNDKYGKNIVDQSLSVWSALNKAVKRDASISNMVMRVKSPPGAWTSLNSMMEDEDRSLVKGNATKNFESLAIVTGETAREYAASARGQANEVG